MLLKNLRGISEKREKELNKLGIFDADDLINYFPRNYLDMTKPLLLKDAFHNEMAFIFCKVISNCQTLTSSRFTKYVKFFCEQDGQPFTAIWFNQPYVEKMLKEGEDYFFYGRVQNKYGNITLVNPTFELAEKNFRLKGIVPVYSLRGSLGQKIIKDAIISAINGLTIESVIPQKINLKYSLYPLNKAYLQAHNPVTFKEKDEASNRIALEEYFILISTFKFLKGGKDEVRHNKYNISTNELREFITTFPFEFTAGQKIATNEIYKDLNSPKQMNRLIQGDVGCGKTAVAICAIFMAVKSGYQVAMLSPTEVLANQNFKVLQKYLSGFNIAYLSGSLTVKQKTTIKQQLINGETNILCGTHAVLTEDTKFKNLSLCVCDEQHRFGVSQRSSLMDKGGNIDMLVMSATPIPRTLSLVFYGDLDISTIKDKPAKRIEIKTVIVPPYKRDKMLMFLEEEMDKGRQVYFVCPKIEDDEGEILSVKELFEELNGVFAKYKVGLLHGKMKDKEKNQIMQSFKDGDINCLVSTTVIEVGVDVQNATIMVIESAERFGLSQLHQLRGRVGRGDIQSYCFLLFNFELEKAAERMKLFKSTSDGFKIAEYDYELRGSGDFLGARQSGKFIGDIKNLSFDPKQIFVAKKLCDEAFDNSYDLTNLKNACRKRYNKLKNIVLN